jgi:hypothetical protein
MSTRYFIQSVWQAIIASLLAVVLIALSFFMTEPTVGQAVTSGPFTIKTTITDEISFLVNAANVVATGSINGITGGTANGSTTAVVRTNSSNGYNMTLAFFDNGSGHAMQGDVSDSDSIRDYAAVGGQPTFLFSTASTSAVFGYTVSADDTSDVDPSFLNNGAACNVGSTHTSDRCWMEPSTTGFTIINRASEATTGATSTISFRIHVPSNPSPGLVADVYTATATLTALNQ